MTVTVAQATQHNRELAALVTSEEYWASGYHQVATIGYRTDPASLMPEGPPWQVHTTWSVNDPPAEFVAAALNRADTLAASGFHRQPWNRPDPEPDDNRAYEDERGYSVWARAETTPVGDAVFEVTVTSPPCVDE